MDSINFLTNKIISNATQTKSPSFVLEGTTSGLISTSETSSNSQDDDLILEIINQEAQEPTPEATEGKRSNQPSSKVTIEAKDGGYIVVAEINSQRVQSEELEILTDEIMEQIGENGFSTTSAGSGDILIGTMDQALATQNVWNCACLVLYNDMGEQMLFHVFGSANVDSISSAIRENFSEHSITNAIIIPGGHQSTSRTVEMIHSALTEEYSDVQISFMHTNIESPTIVAYNGNIYQTQTPQEGTLFPVGDVINDNPPYTLEEGLPDGK